MKRLFAFLCFATLCGIAHSQNLNGKEYVFSVGLEGGCTVGNYSVRNPLMYGGSVQADYYFYETAALTLKAAYQFFPTTKSIYHDSTGRRYEYQPPHHYYIPFMVGLKINITEKIYLHPQAGVVYRNIGPMGGCYGLGGGVEWKHIDLSLRFEGIQKKTFDAGYLAVRAAYTF